MVMLEKVISLGKLKNTRDLLKDIGTPRAYWKWTMLQKYAQKKQLQKGIPGEIGG